MSTPAVAAKIPANFSANWMRVWCRANAPLHHFLAQEAWDFVELVITGTDRLQHFLWTSCEGDGPERDRAREYYHKCDALCRVAVEAYLGDASGGAVYAMSDHGFCKIDHEFHINAWLRQEGYLRFDREPPESYADIHADSVAFALDPGSYLPSSTRTLSQRRRGQRYRAR